VNLNAWCEPHASTPHAQRCTVASAASCFGVPRSTMPLRSTWRCRRVVVAVMCCAGRARAVAHCTHARTSLSSMELASSAAQRWPAAEQHGAHVWPELACSRAELCRQRRARSCIALHDSAAPWPAWLQVSGSAAGMCSAGDTTQRGRHCRLCGQHRAYDGQHRRQ
jgi:hypothetical protein